MVLNITNKGGIQCQQTEVVMFNRLWAEEAADRSESRGVNPGYATGVLADMHPYVGKSSKQKTASLLGV